MSAIDLGADATVSWAAGTADLTVTLTVTLPDGTTTTPPVTPSGSTYSATVTASQAGRHLLSWAADGLAYTDVLDVWPADPRFLVGIGDVLSGLQIKSYTPSASDLSDMRLFIAAATPVIEDIVGTVLTQTKTRKVNGGRAAVLVQPNIASVTSVVVDGVALAEGSGYTVDEAAGIIYAGAWPGSTFPAGLLNVVVTYVVGSSVIPPNIRQAAIELVVHNWQQGRQADHAPLPEGVEMVQTPGGYWVPLRVYQLCKPDRRTDGFG